MLINYFKIAFRSFTKHKTFTLLNILGLALGMAASLLILQYVKYETSYDSFHSNSKRIYRIQYNQYQNGNLTFECAAAVPAVGPALKDNFEEVRQFTRLYPVSGVVTYRSSNLGEISFREEKMQIADPAVFEIFDFKLLKGNVETCLDGPNKAVISASAAKKYFHDDDPIGKRINWNGPWEFEITGVIEDVPENSHITFNFLFSYQTLNDRTDNASETAWGWYDFNTYVLLESSTNVEVLQAKWDEHLLEVRGESWEKSSSKQEFIFQPLLDIHLYSNLLQESNPDEQGDGDAVYFLTIIAFFILIIAWVNYINLSTAKSFERAREVGIRKVMGAYKSQLRNQFIAESILINLFAMVIAVGIVIVSWPFFSSLTGRTIPFSLVYEPAFWLLSGGLFLSGALLSGFYPAWVLSSFKPVIVLKGKLSATVQGALMRKGLVVFQFFASVVLISGTLIVSSQLDFMKNQDLGIDIYKTMVLEGPGVTDSLYAQKLESFKTETMRISGISSITASSNIPGNEIFWTNGIRRLSGGPESRITVYNIGIDYDYIPSFDLKILAGRNFSKDFPSDSEGILLNKSLAESIEYMEPEEAIGQKVILGGDTLEVLGVIDDYHQMSLKNNTAPIVMRLSDASSFFALKIETSDYQQILGDVKIAWDEFFPGNPYDYFFLDDFFNRQYNPDRQFGQVFGLFSMLAIFVSCLGLFGLASFMTAQRTKEVGIRKALGSSVPGISILLASGFVRLVIIGALAATPIAWYIMSLWLETFPYHIDINPMIFVVSGLIVIIIAVGSVGYQTINAALASPAETLRYE